MVPRQLEGECPDYKSCPNNALFEQRLDAICDKINLNFKLNALALDKAEKLMDARLESMNDIRKQLVAQAATFMSQAVYDSKHSEIQRQVDELRLSRANLEGKASMASVYIAYVISFVTLLLALVDHFKP